MAECVRNTMYEEPSATPDTSESPSVPNCRDLMSHSTIPNSMEVERVMPGGCFVPKDSLVAADPCNIDVDGVTIKPVKPGLWSTVAITNRICEGETMSTLVAQLVVLNEQVVEQKIIELSGSNIPADLSTSSQNPEFFHNLPWKPAADILSDGTNKPDSRAKLHVDSGYAGVFCKSTVPGGKDWIGPWLNHVTDQGHIYVTGDIPGPIGVIVASGHGFGGYDIDVCQDSNGLIWACRVVCLKPSHGEGDSNA